MKSRRKNQRKYDSTNNNYQSNENYTVYNNNITKKLYLNVYIIFIYL